MKKINVYGIDVTKALIFIFITSIFTTFMMMFMIIPTIKDLKIAKIKNQHAYKNYRNDQVLKDQKIAQLQKLKDENIKAISSLQGIFDKESLQKIISQSFLDSKVSEAIESEYEEFFTKKELNIKTQLSEPKDFYDFVERLNTINSAGGINFPIEINSENNRLYLNYKIDFYWLRELNSSYKALGSIAK